MEKPQTDQEFFELLTEWRDAGFMNMIEAPSLLHEKFEIPKIECIRIFTDWYWWLQRQPKTMDNTTVDERHALDDQ